MNNLSQGSTGPAVKNLQGLLNFHLDGTGSAPLVLDSIFGPKTRAAVVKFQRLCNITVDGIVGPQTRAALLDARCVTGVVLMSPGYQDSPTGVPAAVAPALARARMRKGTQMPLVRSSPILLASDAQGQPAGQPAPSVVETTVVVQTGQQVNINPWFFSPFVATVQANIIVKNDGRRPFVISPGLQLFFNQVGSPSGSWSGQAFVQMGPTELFKRGEFDLLNPFVQAFVQLNSGSPAGAGFAIGNQANYNLLGDKLSLFVNLQAVSSTALNNGITSVPSVQVLGGVAIDVFQIFGKK